MKELLWIDKGLVNKLKLLEEVEEIDQVEIKKYIREFNEQVETLSEEVDSSVLGLRAKAQKVRETYKKVVEDEITSIDKLWCELDNKRYESTNKISQASKSISSIQDEVNRLKRSIKEIDFYAINNVIELVDKVSNMNSKQLELLEKLVKFK